MSVLPECIVVIDMPLVRIRLGLTSVAVLTGSKVMGLSFGMINFVVYILNPR